MTTTRPYKIVDPFYRRPFERFKEMSVLPKREPSVCVPDLAGDIEHILPGDNEQAHVLVTEFAPTNGFCNLRSQLCLFPLPFDPTPFAEWTHAVGRQGRSSLH